MTWVYLTVTFKKSTGKNSCSSVMLLVHSLILNHQPLGFLGSAALTPDRKEGRFKKQTGRHYSHNCYNLISCDGFWFIEKNWDLLLKTNLILIFPTRIQHLNPLQFWYASFFVGELGCQWGLGLGGCMHIKWRSNKSSKVDRTMERSFETSPDGETSTVVEQNTVSRGNVDLYTDFLWTR